MPSCLRKIRPLLQEGNLNTTRTPRTRLLRSPGTYVDSTFTENCSFRKSHGFFGLPRWRGEQYRVDAISFRRARQRAVISRDDHLWIILSKLPRRSTTAALSRPLGELPRFFADIFVAWATEVHRSRSPPPPLPTYAFRMRTRVRAITTFPDTYESRFGRERIRVSLVLVSRSRTLDR